MKKELELNELKLYLDNKTIEESFKVLNSLFPGELIFTTSFGMEDQVITDIIFSNDISVDVVTIDTGRLFPETYKVFSDTTIRYRKNISVYFPDYLAVEKLVSEKGPFSFHKSIENRMECCRIRKVVPLGRALREKKCWISGIRADQSENRAMMTALEYDNDKKLFKYYPLFNWSAEDVRIYLEKNNVPYNSLHDKGFVSIGCEPCTRAIHAGEDFRAGRWWWETNNIKECGCHLK